MLIKAKDAHDQATNSVIRLVSLTINSAIERGQFQTVVEVPNMQVALAIATLKAAGYAVARVAHSKTHEDIRVSWEEV